MQRDLFLLVMLAGSEVEIQTENGQGMVGTDIVTAMITTVMTAAGTRVMTGTETTATVTVTAVIGTEMAVNGWKTKEISHESVQMVESGTKSRVTGVDSNVNTPTTKAEVCSTVCIVLSAHVEQK